MQNTKQVRKEIPSTNLLQILIYEDYQLLSRLLNEANQALIQVWDSFLEKSKINMFDVHLDRLEIIDGAVTTARFSTFEPANLLPCVFFVEHEGVLQFMMLSSQEEFVFALQQSPQWIIPSESQKYWIVRTDLLPRHTYSTTGFKFIDLFAGIGGFHEALHNLGGECVLACEMDEEARKVYRAKFPDLFEGILEDETERVFPKNIRTITLDEAGEDRTLEEIRKLVPAHDVLCGGFPCQPFSKSGAQEGVNDKVRGTLFFDLMQIVSARKPKYVFLENVSNLAGPKHKDTWKTIIQVLHNQGYVVNEVPLVLSPHNMPAVLGGAPQTRTRVFILAIRHDDLPVKINEVLFEKGDLPKFDKHSWDIRDVIDPVENANKTLLLSEQNEAWLKCWEYFVQMIPADKLPGFPIWSFEFKSEPDILEEMPNWKQNFLQRNSDFYNEHKDLIDDWMEMDWGPINGESYRLTDFPNSRQKFEWQAQSYHSIQKDRTIKDLLLQFRPSGIRVKPPSYTPALVAMNQTPMVGPILTGLTKFRKLSPMETAKLQGMNGTAFTKAGVKDSAAYKQLGNAVNVGIIQMLMVRLLAGFTNYENSISETEKMVRIEEQLTLPLENLE